MHQGVQGGEMCYQMVSEGAPVYYQQLLYWSIVAPGDKNVLNLHIRYGTFFLEHPVYTCSNNKDNK